MSVHTELMNEATDVLAEVHGTPAALLYFATPASQDPKPWDAISIGEVRVDEEEDLTGSDFDELLRMEKLTVKIRGPQRIHLKGQVQVGDDQVRWNVESVRGGGTAVVMILLERPHVMEAGRAGRKR